MAQSIIIDGVDVGECPYAEPAYKTPKCRIHDYIHCDGINCHYKRMLHTGKEKDIYKNENKLLHKKLKAKEQECEELEKLLKVRIEDLCDSCGASSMMPMPCKVYEKTLTEIKEIASHYNDMSGNCVIVNFFEDMCKILQKISECEVTKCN